MRIFPGPMSLLDVTDGHGPVYSTKATLDRIDDYDCLVHAFVHEADRSGRMQRLANSNRISMVLRGAFVGAKDIIRVGGLGETRAGSELSPEALAGPPAGTVADQRQPLPLDSFPSPLAPRQSDLSFGRRHFAESSGSVLLGEQSPQMASSRTLRRWTPLEYSPPILTRLTSLRGFFATGKTESGSMKDNLFWRTVGRLSRIGVPRRVTSIRVSTGPAPCGRVHDP